MKELLADLRKRRRREEQHPPKKRENRIDTHTHTHTQSEVGWGEETVPVYQTLDSDCSSHWCIQH